MPRGFYTVSATGVVSKEYFLETPPCRETVTPTSYPSAFFTAQPGRPTIAICDWAMNVDAVGAHLENHFTDADLSIDLVCWYLNEVAKTLVTNTCVNVWNSFGVDLVAAGGPATVSSIYRVTHKEGTIPTLGATPVWTGSVAGLVGMLLAVYQMNTTLQLRRDACTTTTIGRIEAILSKSPYSMPPTRISGITKHSYWNNDKSYVALVAAYDMYFYKFSESHFASLRVGTLQTRYKDCGALDNINILSVAMGIPKEEVPYWAFTHAIGKEILAISKDDQEITEPNSYMPYMRSLGISDKSPYSCTQNKHCHHWAHFTSALSGKTRSINAKVIGYDNLCGLANISMGIMFLKSKGVTVKRAPMDTEKAAREMMDAAGLPVFDEDALPRFNPDSVRDWFNGWKSGPPPEVVAWAKRIVSQWTSVRVGSVGTWLKDFIISI